MADDPRNTGQAPGTRTMVAPPARPGLLRSLAHRLAGEPVALPVEGHLASFDGATTWLNSEPLTPQGLRGRVVLVDFWTYTCVNWLRTAPYVQAWAAKYRDDGLTVIGVHTPEFRFEHDLENVRAAIGWFDVKYPVAVDNDYGVWRAFANHYWPALYLADAEGRIRYHHFGEGEYAAAEMAIQQLLMDAGEDEVDEDLVAVDPHGLEVAADWQTLQSPETYVGYGQATGFAQEGEAAYDEPHLYAPPALGPNQWALAGKWTVGQHAGILNEPGGRLSFRFHARDLNLVMGPASRGRSVAFRVLLDGQPPDAAAGTDISGNGGGFVSEQRTYQLIRQPGGVLLHLRLR
jgi:thiol-disulfide isomerase/thioredoxin